MSSEDNTNLIYILKQYLLYNIFAISSRHNFYEWFYKKHGVIIFGTYIAITI